MATANLWRIPEEAESARTPTVILKELANHLAGLTDRVLIARVSRSALTRTSTISISLYVVAPSLDDYSVEILNLRHPLLKSYPSSVRSSINDLNQDVNSEEELLEAVEKILSSQEMSNILRSLLNESQLGSA